MFILFYHTFLLLYHVTYGKISLSVFGNLTKNAPSPWEECVCMIFSRR